MELGEGPAVIAVLEEEAGRQPVVGANLEVDAVFGDDQRRRHRRSGSRLRRPRFIGYPAAQTTPIPGEPLDVHRGDA